MAGAVVWKPLPVSFSHPQCEPGLFLLQPATYSSNPVHESCFALSEPQLACQLLLPPCKTSLSYNLQPRELLPRNRGVVEACPSTRPGHGDGVSQGEVAQLVLQLLHLALLILKHLRSIKSFSAVALGKVWWFEGTLAKPGGL